MSDDADSDCTVGIIEDDSCNITQSPSMLSSGAAAADSCSNNSSTQFDEQSSGRKSVTTNGTDNSLTLEQIISEQEKILQQGNMTSDDEDRVKMIERALKDMGLVNQKEREHITSTFSSIASKNLPKSETMATTERLRKQLIALSERQKRLLFCVSRQKQITSMLEVQEKGKTIDGNDKGRSSCNADTHPPFQSKPAQCLVPQHFNDTATTDMPVIIEVQKNVVKADFSQPVGLEALIKQGFIKPGKDCLSCTLMGCTFKGSLLRNGSIQVGEGTTGRVYTSPQQWLSTCWSKLGHNKKITRKQAYKNIFYVMDQLIVYCEMYNKRQVDTYKQKQSQLNTSKPSLILHDGVGSEMKTSQPMNSSRKSDGILDDGSHGDGNHGDGNRGDGILGNGSSHSNSSDGCGNRGNSILGDGNHGDDNHGDGSRGVGSHSNRVNKVRGRPNSLAQPTDTSSCGGSFNLKDILTNGLVVMHQVPTDGTSLTLPDRFWSDEKEIPMELMEVINRDLSNW